LARQVGLIALGLLQNGNALAMSKVYCGIACANA
jgi:hypothetical protein